MTGTVLDTYNAGSSRGDSAFMEKGGRCSGLNREVPRWRQCWGATRESILRRYVGNPMKKAMEHPERVQEHGALGGGGAWSRGPGNRGAAELWEEGREGQHTRLRGPRHTPTLSFPLPLFPMVSLNRDMPC